MKEPSLENLIAEAVREPEEARYIWWLRQGVRAYLQDHTPAELKANWTEVRARILEQHGYGPSNS